jgi:hypothetical protein
MLCVPCFFSSLSPAIFPFSFHPVSSHSSNIECVGRRGQSGTQWRCAAQLGPHSSLLFLLSPSFFLFVLRS